MAPNATASMAYAGTRKRTINQIVPGAASPAQNDGPDRDSRPRPPGAVTEASSRTLTGSRRLWSSGGELRPLVLPHLVGVDGQRFEPQPLGDDGVGQHRR